MITKEDIAQAVMRLNLNDYERSSFASGAQWALEEIKNRTPQFKDFDEWAFDRWGCTSRKELRDHIEDTVILEFGDLLAAWQASAVSAEKKHQAEIEALKTKYKELESYIENILLPADKIKIVKIKDSMPQCFRCGYVKSDFEGDYKGTDYQIDQYQAEIKALRAKLESATKAATLGLSFAPTGKVPEGLFPTSYHTLSYEAECKLQQEVDLAREVIKQLTANQGE